MFNTKLIFWISVAVLIALIDPDTLIKIAAVLWVLFVAYWGSVRLMFAVAKRKGAVKVDFGCEYRAHSIHCATMGLSPSDGECNCVPTHPTHCGHCT